MKNSNDTIGGRTRDLPACSAVPQPTAPPRALIMNDYKIQAKPSPTYFRFNIILKSISRSSQQPLSDFRNKTLYARFLCPMRARCPASHTFLNLVTRIIQSCRLRSLQVLSHIRKLPKKCCRHGLGSCCQCISAATCQYSEQTCVWQKCACAVVETWV